MSPRERCALAALVASALACGGCQQPGPGPDINGDQAQAFLRLLTPRTIEIQRFLTKPVSFEGTGDADGVEVILSTKDTFGDGVKCVGAFLFELYERRMASGDPYGERIAFWTAEVASDESMMEYWDSLSRFYVFPLKLDQRRLAPGEYILTAQLETPMGQKLSDDYAFSHSGAAHSASEP
jgi:hypothetical protein